MDMAADPVPDVVVMVHRAGIRWLNMLQEVVRDLNAGTGVVSVVNLQTASVQLYFDDERPRSFKLDPARVPAMRQLFA